MVAYIRSDLDFILAQIKIAEAHAAFERGVSTGDSSNPARPLFGPNGSIPAYNVAWGLRTVDGTYNHLLPGQTEWGASDNEFPEPLGTNFRTIMVPAGPGGALVPVSYTPGADNDGPGPANPGDVFDPTVRVISNLLVDQTLGNPSAILTGLQRAGVVPPDQQMAVTAQISAAYQPLKPLFNAVGTAEREYASASAAASASPGNEALQAQAAARLQELTQAKAALEAADDALMTLLANSGIELDGANVKITNAAPDEGLSAPFNSWFTLFGQFFDHGLDLVAKGGNGTVFIPLMPDDPLYVQGGNTNFMVLTRATLAGPGQDGVMGTADDTNRPVNTTTSYVDQNQTYSSHPSHQVFLRQYELNANGDPVSTGKLLEGSAGGMATWADLKAQAADMLGIQLLDSNVGNIPLLATDPYGEFIRGPNGYPQMVTTTGLVEGDPAANGGLGVLVPANAIRTGHAFLADIAHTAVPTGLADGDLEIGLGNPGNEPGAYDNELLDAHFVAGDGRANENIGLTAVHHVFHSEHNRLVEHTKAVVLADAQDMLAKGASQAEAVAFLNEWLAVDVAEVPANANGLAWDGERIFQAAKFGTEMQYQHLVFEEFGRKIQPNINVFLVPDGFDTTIDPSIVAEFAHVVYRFGHSMLNEQIDRFDPNFNPDHIGLIEGFLNPMQFQNNGGTTEVNADIAAGAIIRGMTRQQGNEIDEFVTGALRNNLLGLPLDLATINLARGRDTGVPSLNEARAQFYEASNQNALLKPYESWTDFAGHLKHEASIINFIAAYGTHPLITGESTVDGKRDAALTLITGIATGKFAAEANFEMPADRLAFLNATGGYATGSLGGLNNVDLWIGGLAEEIMPFGGMLGSTFNFVFELQMEKLQNADRFYYLQRLDGLHLFGEMENNSFAAMIMRNTDATHLPSDVFSTPGLILEVDRSKQFNDLDGDGTLESADPVGSSLLTPLVIRDNPLTTAVETNYLRYTGAEHAVLGGTNAADTIIASDGDDTLYGDGGNDRLEGDFGNDIINGGDGDDIIVDSGGDDNIKGGAGNDVVHAGPGLDLVMGNTGQDFIFLGTDMGSEVFAGEGDDFIYGNRNAERILGNEGNDWIETGTFDGAPGDNFDEVFAHDAIDGHDVFLGDGGFDEFIGEGGDDIMVGSAGRGKMAGMSGFDWATYKDSAFGVNADLSIPIVFDESPTLPQNAALDEYASMEGLSGSRFNDTLAGSNALGSERLPFDPSAPAGTTGQEGYRGSQITKESLALIAGLAQVLGLTTQQVAAMAAGTVVYNAGDIILGGDGSDIIQGNAGDDIIDGDKWLDVQIAVYETTDRTGTPIAYHNSMTTLAASMFNGSINPGQLGIVRTIKTDTTSGDIDTAKFQGSRGEYTFSATADGQVIVSHAVEDSLDGTDKLRNIERVQFADGGALNIITGTPYNDNGLAPQGAAPLNQPVLNGTAGDDLILGLAGADSLNGGNGNDVLVGGADGTNIITNTASYADTFNTPGLGNSNGSSNWIPDWAESNDGTGQTNQIRIDDGNNVLRFYGGTGMNGAEITREVDLQAATTATITYDYDADNLDAGEFVLVRFAADGVNYTTLATIDANDNGSGNHVVTGPFSAAARIRFEVSGINETVENVEIDNLVINYTTLTSTPAGDTLNGGLGDDTYSFSLGDGTDVINESASATSGGTADKISILAPVTGTDVDGLPIYTIASLTAQDNDVGTNNGDLVINYSLPNGATSVAQTITVVNHFDGTNAETGVERINFNGAGVYGYALGSEDYLISRLDPFNRTAGGVNLSASTVNNFIAGEQGVDDVITGGSGNDLIFGASGSNDLVGGLGDDLLVGGTANDDLDTRLNAAGDDFEGAIGADVMVGGSGNDTYGVDDLLDLVVEAVGEGTDTVETFMAELSITAMANVENLVYRGGDAGAFVGTGNAGNNVIAGGDLNDTLSSLAGNDTLNGGLGADTMIGGEGNDTYVVDDVGDVVNETTGLAADVDTVQSSIGYTLAAGLENLTLIGGDAINGTGNAGINTIIGNGADNQLFGGGDNDTLTGNDGNDLLDGGEGNDTINGGDDNDTIIGGAGNDTIDVGTGFNRIVYNAAGFGNDIINSFDAAGGTATTQDLIDLSAFGLTAANIGTTAASRIQIQNVAEFGLDDTLITIRDAGGAVMGTIHVEDAENAITASDFIFTPVAPVNFGSPTAGADAITGNDAANTINGLGGNDTLSGAGGDDVVNGGEGADTLNGGDGNDTLTGGVSATTGSIVDNFSAVSYANNNGNFNFTDNWNETGDNDAANSGDILITGGRLTFAAGTDNNDTIQRAINLNGATAPTLTFDYQSVGLDAGEMVIVQALNGATWETLGTLGGTALTSFSAPLNPIHSAIRFVATGGFEAGESFHIDNVVVALGPNSGVDTINGDAGDDTIIWNANAAAPTDGKDMVNGGTEGAAGDTFVINGDASAETYRIYTRAEAAAVGITGLNANTEIVITRNGTNNASVIAELAEIEEIRVNGFDPAGNGSIGGDTIEIIGNFSQTSLRPNTITINGNAGDDTIDISSLQSAHRIVFRSNGGNDTIVGTLRDQDVIELAPGLTVADYSKTVNENGTVTLKSDTHSVTYMSDGEPVIKECEEDEEDNEDPVVAGERFTVRKGEAITLTAAQLLANDVDPDGGTLSIFEIDEDEHGKAVLNSDGTITFTPKAGFTGEASFTYTVADGQGGKTEGTVTIVVEKPAPMAVNGGRGHDRLYGDDADDRIKGGDGHDRLDGGAGADKMWGGRGNDTYIVDDRSDRVYESRGQGVDTVKAGVSYSLSGTHVEKLVLTGSGNLDGTGNGLDNSITGNAGSNELKGGAGEDALKGMGGRDKLHGGSGDDRLDGGSGNDEIHGGSGRDKLRGGSGDDRLDGGSGNDKLHGDSGLDVFVFENGSGWDTVADFRSGQDRIDVSGLSGVKGKSDLNLTQMGEDAVIWHGSDILVLKGVQASDLDSSDFVF